jgi:hypothetical protein
METATARMIDKNVFMVLKYRCRQLVCACRFRRDAVSAESIRGGDDTAKIASNLEVIRKNYEKDTNATFSPLCSVQAECRRQSRTR